MKNFIIKIRTTVIVSVAAAVLLASYTDSSAAPTQPATKLVAKPAAKAVTKPTKKVATKVTNTKTLGSEKATTKTAQPPAKQESQSANKIWLSVDVVEQTATAQGVDGSKDKYRSDAEVNIVDSATSKNVYARSGDMIQLQPRRTYFVILSTMPQASNGGVLKVQGPRTQILRTGTANDGDVMYERKFVLAGGSTAATNPKPASEGKISRKSEPEPFPNGKSSKSYSPSGSPSGAGETEDADLSRSSGNTRKPTGSAFSSPPSSSSPSSLSSPMYYVIQYCSLAEEQDALAIRTALVQNGVRDARVELYDDGMGRRFYRVRSGSYPTIPQAKSVANSPVWSEKQWQLLKMKPIVVPANL